MGSSRQYENLEGVVYIFEIVIYYKSSCLKYLSFFTGDTHVVEIPKSEMEVVKGQMAVLHAWYSPNSDISQNAVTWQFIGNGTKPVSSSKRKSAGINRTVNPILTFSWENKGKL